MDAGGGGSGRNGVWRDSGGWQSVDVSLTVGEIVPDRKLYLSHAAVDGHRTTGHSRRVRSAGLPLSEVA